ncbi:MAG: ATP-binding protein [Ancrocorticia sp.]
MGHTDLLDALTSQDEALFLDLPVTERLRLAVDSAYTGFLAGKTSGLIRRAKLRYPDADLRTLDLVEQRGLDRSLIAELATYSFITARRNIIIVGFTGSGKTFLASAIAKASCGQCYRTMFVRMPDLVQAWDLATDKPGGASKFIRKYAAYTVLVLDEWLLDKPGDSTRTMLLELMEARYDKGATIFVSQYGLKDWHHRLGAGVHADAICDRIVHGAITINTGQINMREHTTTNHQPH